MENRYRQEARGIDQKRGRLFEWQHSGLQALGERLGHSKVRITPIALRQGLTAKRVARVLRAARALIEAGWIEGVPWSDDGRRYSLVGAIRSGVNDALGSRYALLLLESVLGEADLCKWARNPVRTHRQVLAAIDDALDALGPTKKERRGGWNISHGPGSLH